MKTPSDMAGYLATVILGLCVVVMTMRQADMKQAIQMLQENQANHKGLIIDLQSGKAARSEMVSVDLKIYDIEQRLKTVEKIK